MRAAHRAIGASILLVYSWPTIPLTPTQHSNKRNGCLMKNVQTYNLVPIIIIIVNTNNILCYNKLNNVASPKRISCLIIRESAFLGIELRNS